MGWLYMRHPETGGASLIPDDSSVLEVHEAKGWQRFAMPAELDPDAPNLGAITETVAVDVEPILSADDVAGLRGQALDDALEAAGLSKSGTVAEKRARLAEYEADLADTTEEEIN